MDTLNCEVNELARGSTAYHIQKKVLPITWETVESHSSLDMTIEEARHVVEKYRDDYPEFTYRVVELSAKIIF